MPSFCTSSLTSLQESPLLVEGGWRERDEEPEKQVVYIVPITSILGRLPLIPAGDHGTIPAALRGSKRDLFPLGICDEDRQPGTGSKLFYISSWAMCLPTDHPKKPKT